MNSEQQFTDASGNTWELRFSFRKLRDIAAKTKLDLSGEGQSGVVVMLRSETAKLAETLWLLVKDQAAEKQVDQDSFYDALDGEALDAGWQALLEAFIAFAPKGNQDKLRDIIAKQIATMEQSTKQLLEKINSPETQAAIDAKLAEIEANFLAKIRGLSQAR